jgi:CheY-like chemotaxis protein
MADPGQITQVLLNLAVNARDAMPKGGELFLETAVETLAEPLAVTAEDPLPAGDYIALRVTDTGIGMDEATLARVFEPFFTTKPISRGTGLGLSTVYGVVRQHGGTVRVSSRPGVGTTFTVLLPVLPLLAAPDPAETAQPSPAPTLLQPATGRKALLLLEDDDSIRELLQRVLVREGYEVFAARTPDAAAHLLTAHGTSIDLLVSDVVLTGSSGPEFYRDVVVPRYPDVGVLFMSGYSDTEVLETGVIRHDHAFIAKPFTPSQIVEAVNTALGGSRGGPAGIRS